ncbi:MAG: hypothetical protein IJ362_10220 [Oscillospiraceae bacterium]|nr:hypothetical protein [Oscillospiraceae bacterium]
MKKLSSLILAIILLFTACGAKEKYPPQKQDFGGGDYTWHYYNDRGQRIRYEAFRDEKLTEIHHFEYDADGNVIKKQTTDPDGNELVRDEITYESGKQTYLIRYRNGLISMEDYYDENENVYLSKLYKEGRLNSITETFYGEDKLATMSICYRPDGTAQWMQEYGDNEEGRFTTRTSYFDENEEVIKIVLKTSTANGYKEEILFDRDAQ